MRNNILSRLQYDMAICGGSLKEFYKQLVTQVEALYIVAVLKSVILVFYDDVFKEKFARRYHIKKIVEEKQLASKYYALESYELNHGPIEKLLSQKQLKEVL